MRRSPFSVQVDGFQVSAARLDSSCDLECAQSTAHRPLLKAHWILAFPPPLLHPSYYALIVCPM